MNISSTELAALGSQFGVVGQSASAALQAVLSASMWSVVVLQRCGDAQQDPYRTINSFATKAAAMAFALPLKFTDRTDAVMLYNGTNFDSVISGDRNLTDLYCTRANVTHPAPTAVEVAAVTVQVVAPKPAAIITKPASSKK